MAQNEQTTEEHSTLEQQSPRRLDHPSMRTQYGASDNGATIVILCHSVCSLYYVMYNNMKQNTKTTKAARKTSHRQWRSQECELGGPPSLLPLPF